MKTRIAAIKGMTLTEAMFSSVIIALLLGGMMAISAQVVDNSRRINDEYAAVSIARSRIEYARSYVQTNGFANLTNSRFGETDTKLDENGTPDQDGRFLRSSSVTTNFGSNSRLTQVTVAVTYVYRGNRTNHTVTMTNVFAN